MSTTPGHTTKLLTSSTAVYTGSPTWTALSQLTNIDPGALEAADVKASHMESTEQYHEYEPGWAEPGEIAATLQFLKAQQTTLYTLFRTKKGFQVLFQDGSKFEFNGYIKKIGAPKPDMEGLVTVDIVIKVSGKPLFTAAA